MIALIRDGVEMGYRISVSTSNKQCFKRQNSCLSLYAVSAMREYRYIYLSYFLHEHEVETHSQTECMWKCSSLKI